MAIRSDLNDASDSVSSKAIRSLTNFGLRGRIPRKEALS